MLPDALLETALPYPKRRGKVRDVYDVTLADGTDAVALVASDRLSAFDVVMPNGIPGKGRILTSVSRFWFETIADRLGDRLPHHVLSTDPADLPGLTAAQREQIDGRVTIGRRTEVVPIECVARGYLAGSGWKEYQASGTVCGVELPAGLKQCDRLPEPIFTPATKAATGHDENIDFDAASAIAGRETMQTLRELTIAVYEMAAAHAAENGILIADTKLEFGRLPGENEPILVDEALTPDSSRFWPADDYEPGRDQASFDKQYVRNWLQELVDAGHWDKTPPGPELPDEIVANTREKYLEAAQRLTGERPQ